MEKTNETFRVEIFCYKTGETEAIIGNAMSIDRAEKRQMTGLSRCNEDYGTRIINEKTGKVV
jgi:hypothetical protein